MANSRYQKAREFEYAVRDDMVKRNYIAVRAAGSKTPADIYAFDLERKVFIQCKTNGVMRPEEWNRFYRYSRSVGAIPILAMRNKSGRGILYRLLTGEKVAYQKQPMTEWIPEKGVRYEVPRADDERDRVQDRHRKQERQRSFVTSF
jgi:Holliday junction resolvase